MVEPAAPPPTPCGWAGFNEASYRGPAPTQALQFADGQTDRPRRPVQLDKTQRLELDTPLRRSFSTLPRNTHLVTAQTPIQKGLAEAEGWSVAAVASPIHTCH